MDKKQLDDGWTPTEYEIYSVEQEPVVKSAGKKTTETNNSKKRFNL